MGFVGDCPSYHIVHQLLAKEGSQPELFTEIIKSLFFLFCSLTEDLFLDVKMASCVLSI